MARNKKEWYRRKAEELDRMSVEMARARKNPGAIRAVRELYLILREKAGLKS